MEKLKKYWELIIVLLILLVCFLITSCNSNKTSCYYSKVIKEDSLYFKIKGTEEQKCIILEHSKYALNSDTFITKNNTKQVVKVKPSHKMARFILETNWGKDYKWVLNNNPGGMFNGKTFLKFNNPYLAWGKMGECINRLGKDYSKKDSTKQISKIIKLYNLEALDYV